MSDKTRTEPADPVLEDFLARFDANWFASRATGADPLTVKLVLEIKRLRAELVRDAEARAIIHEAAELVRTRGA